MSTPSPSPGSVCMRAIRWRLSALSSQTMSVSKWLNCCSLVSGTTSARVSQFLLGCSLSKPVRYCRRVSALGPWVKCTRSGAKNSASSGSGARGACGNRACFWALRLIRLGYHRFTGSDKVVLGILVPRNTDSLEAYDDLLRGLHYFAAGTKDGNTKARQM